MAMKYVLGTNIIIHSLEKNLEADLPHDGLWHVSIITELELLSYPDLSAKEEKAAAGFLSSVQRIGLTPEICSHTLRVRRKNRLKPPDAIIAATALAENAVLLTNDHKLHGAESLECRELAVRQ